MNDYISRQAAIDTTYKLRENFKCWDRYDDVVIRKAYADIPTADVRKNVRGEWIEVLRDTYGGGHFPFSKCSVCQSEQIMDSNFCPNCGADMRGEQNDN